MTTWIELVRTGLRRYHEQTERTEIELEEVYNYTLEQARSEFPDNSHPKAKIRQTLQLLRDDDAVAFSGDGEYRLLEPLTEGEPSSVSSLRRDFTAETYETTTSARSIDPEFRETVLRRFENTCPVSGVDHPGLLDVAHVLSWSDHPDERADVENVIALDKTHHAAFDAELFTLDDEFRLWANPGFETESEILERTITAQDGERIDLPSAASVAPEYLRTRNQQLDWWAP